RGLALTRVRNLAAQAGERCFVDAVEFFELRRQVVEALLLDLCGGERALLQRLVFLEADEAADDLEARLWVGVEERRCRALLQHEGRREGLGREPHDLVE